MVSRDELNGVITRLQAEGISVNRDLAYLVAMKLDSIRSRGKSFGEALRLALNECHVQEPEVRKKYSKVLGAYFGSHGGKKAAHNRRNAIPPQKQEPSQNFGVKVEANGQFAFEI